MSIVLKPKEHICRLKDGIKFGVWYNITFDNDKKEFVWYECGDKTKT